MTVRLILENAPRPQAVTERSFEDGQLVIGRSDDADWQLDDPEMFVSRRHCILSLEDGRVMATDTSSGGLYVDNAAHPVGSGNRVVVEPGMRLRLGDFVIRIEGGPGAGAAETPATAASERPAGGLSFSFDFGAGEPDPAPPPRPDSLPDPFGVARERPSAPPPVEDATPPAPLDREDPFALDLRTPRSQPTPSSPPEDGRSWFDDAPAPPDPRDAMPAPPPSPAAPPAPRDPFGDWTAPVERPVTPDLTEPDAPEPKPEPELRAAEPSMPEPPRPVPPDLPEPAPSVHAPPVPERTPPPPLRAAPPPDLETPAPGAPARPAAQPQAAPAVPPVTEPPAPRTAPSEGDAAVFAALLEGLGLDPVEFAEMDPVQGAAQVGASMRRMTEGVMLLLRTRAQSKQKARVAQTIIASADVNPLKFMATPEDALAIMLEGRSRGYLAADAAVAEAVRDLTDHQVRTFTAVQAALRRMIDRFDPAAIEAEMTDIGLISQLMAGGKGAKLWQLYEDRYRRMAQAAEQDFLGEVGADFRDAYET